MRHLPKDSSSCSHDIPILVGDIIRKKDRHPTIFPFYPIPFYPVIPRRSLFLMRFSHEIPRCFPFFPRLSHEIPRFFRCFGLPLADSRPTHHSAMARHFQRLKSAEDVCVALIAFSKEGNISILVGFLMVF